MKIIEPSFEIIKYDGNDEQQVLQHLERCGRTCYKSEDKITDGSAEKFIANLMERNHEAMIEPLIVIYGKQQQDTLRYPTKL